MNDIKTLKKKEFVRIYNHSASPVIVSMREKQEVVEPMNENGTPGYIDIRWNDLHFINDKTNVFRHGFLRFAEDDKEALYEELGIFDCNEILFEEVIEDIILHPTLEGVQKIVNITSISIIERVKSVLVRLINSEIDVPSKVDKIIRERFKELQYGQRKTNITLSPKEDHTPVKEKDVESLKDEVAALREMVEQLSKGKV